jgi:hypothetical protein
VAADGLQDLARSFFDSRHIALTILGNLEDLHIGREDLVC